MFRSKSLIFLAAVGLGSTGCDLIQSVTSTAVVSGLVLATPTVMFQDWVDMTGETGATMWVGERDGEFSTGEPQPVNDAVAAIESASRVVLSLQQDGVYAASSLDSNLSYQPNLNYTFNASFKGENFGGTTRAPAQLALSNVTFSPELGQDPQFPAELRTHPKAVDLTLTWDKSFGNYAYVSVFRADKATPNMPELVYDTSPKTVQDALDLVAGNPPSEIEIPAATFATDGLYIVLLVTANNGEKKSNTFGVPAFLVGSGVAQLLAVGNVTL